MAKRLRLTARKSVCDANHPAFRLDCYFTYRKEENDTVGTFIVKLHQEWLKVKDLSGAPNDYRAARRAIDKLPELWKFKAELLLGQMLTFDANKNEVTLDYGGFTVYLFSKWINHVREEALMAEEEPEEVEENSVQG